MPITPSLARQITAIGDKMPRLVRARYNQTFRGMCMSIAGTLERQIHRNVFAAQAEPSGAKWEPISPLTKKVREGTGKFSGSSRLGGLAMRKSFQVGQPGNLLKIHAKAGFEFGSKLKQRSHLVAKTFASRFKMPRDVQVAKGGGKSAKYYKSKMRRKRTKGDKIRGFMLAVAGVYAPAPGKQLEHPARPLIYWTPAWERECDKIVVKYVDAAFERAWRDVDSEVRRAQTSLDSMRRTSTAG